MMGANNEDAKLTKICPNGGKASPGDEQDDEDTAPAPTTADSSTSNSKKKKKKKKKRAQQQQSSAQVCIYTTLDTFNVTTTPGVGRCIVASRDLQEGELVLSEPPFAKVVRRDCSLQHCAACCERVSRGVGIQTDMCTIYCTQKCKSTESGLRSLESSLVGKLADVSTATDVDFDLLRMMVRLVLTRARALGLQPVESGDAVGNKGVGWGATGEESFLLQQWRNLHSLMHHRENMKPEWISVVSAAAIEAMRIIPEWAKCDVEEMVELACRVNVNAHGLRDESGSNYVMGVGMFPLTAMINHSCRPNSTFAYRGGTMAVRTLETVKAGTELTVHYIDLLQSTAHRRRELLASKHFLCCCSRCEAPEPIDAYLDGVCCLDCGQGGCLTFTPPQITEQALAAQLALLGEDLADISVSSKPSSGKGRKGKKGNVSRATGNRASLNVVDSDAIRASKGGGEDVGNGTGAETVLYCSSCGREYQTSFIEEGVARAQAAWEVAMAALRATDFPGARKKLQKWLEDFDAGSAPPSSAASKKSVTKKGRIKLHPMHTTVVQTLVPLANCCNYEKDYANSAKYLRRAITAMESVYPPNFPELGDFHAALGEALASFLRKRGQALLPKARDQAARERKVALSRAAAIRFVCLGEDHPISEEARRAVAQV